MSDDLLDDPCLELTGMTAKDLVASWEEQRLTWGQLVDPRVLRIIYQAKVPTADESMIARFLGDMYVLISNFLGDDVTPHSLN